VRVDNDQEAGLQAIIGNDDEDGMATGGDSDRVRVVTARSWLKGSVEGRGGDLDVGGDLEDLDDQLFHLVQDVPAPWTVARVLRLAVISFPDRAP